MSFRDWSIWRLVAIAVTWIVAIVLLMPSPSNGTIQGFDEQGRLFLSGTTYDPVDTLKLASWAVLPPIIMFVAWRVQRR